jgi:hypothetical protein
MTPCHVVMSCSAMCPLVLSWLDAVELELSRHRSRGELIEEADRWRIAESFDGRGVFFPALPASSCNRWPILWAWRWLLPMASREVIYGADTDGKSEAGVRQEYAMDLGYRGLMPLRLGTFLCKTASAGLEHTESLEQEVEEHATARHVQQAMVEGCRYSQRSLLIRPAISVTTLLALGLRRVRAEYAERLDSFSQLLRAQDADGHAAPAPPMVGLQVSLKDRLMEWGGTASGRDVIGQLRWLAPTVATLLARLRAESTHARIPEQLALSLAAVWGIPVAHAGDLFWGPTRPTWEVMRQRLQSPCTCRDSHHAALVSCCWQCGGARLPGHVLSVQACRWCHSRTGTACPGCNRALHYRGACNTWNVGASSLFRPSSGHLHWLCPDCHWLWARSLAASPRCPPAATAGGALLTHLGSLGGRSVPGAGEAVAVPPCPISVRQVRRWLLRSCKGCQPPPTEAVLSRECLHALGPVPERSHTNAARRVADAIRILRHEQLIVLAE